MTHPSTDSFSWFQLVNYNNEKIYPENNTLCLLFLFTSLFYDGQCIKIIVRLVRMKVRCNDIKRKILNIYNESEMPY